MKRVFLIAALALALTGCGSEKAPPTYSLSQDGKAMEYRSGDSQSQICLDGVVYVLIYTGNANATAYVPKFGTDSRVVLCGIPPKPAAPAPVPAPPKPAPASMVI